MPDELRLILALGSALALALVAMPIAIRVARRTDFLDHPVGYKGHGRATPYLGGAALIAAFLPPALIFGGGLSDFAAIVGCAVVLSVVGTVDDRVGLGPLLRVGVEIAAAVVLWAAGIGWFLFDAEPDQPAAHRRLGGRRRERVQPDGQRGRSGGRGRPGELARGVALWRSSRGIRCSPRWRSRSPAPARAFLRFNLARPSRVFLGDGGSMPLGFLIAAMIAALPGTGPLGTEAILAAAAFVALPILDTTLVTFSRLRRGVPVFSGGRDHLTHRLRQRLPSAQAVALILGMTQAAMCVVGVALFQVSHTSVIVAVGGACIAVGAIVILALDWQLPRSQPHASTLPEPARQESGS